MICNIFREMSNLEQLKSFYNLFTVHVWGYVPYFPMQCSYNKSWVIRKYTGEITDEIYVPDKKATWICCIPQFLSFDKKQPAFAAV